MLYAAALGTTSKGRVPRSFTAKVLANAVKRSWKSADGKPRTRCCKMQDSLELLDALEQDPELKRVRAGMASVSARCAERARNAGRAADALDLTALCTDWRTGEELGHRRVPEGLVQHPRAASGLTQLMDPVTPFPDEQALPDPRDPRLDYDKVSSCGIFDLQAAY